MHGSDIRVETLHGQRGKEDNHTCDVVMETLHGQHEMEDKQKQYVAILFKYDRKSTT
jgi:hypothetical protein